MSIPMTSKQVVRLLLNLLPNIIIHTTWIEDRVAVDDEGKKLTRAEKKCKKAFLKIGMKPVPGITRVTLKRRDKIVLYVDNP